MSYFQIEWIQKYLDTDPKVVFDIGSYDGKAGLRIKNEYPESRVISIEADIELFNKMKKNKKLSGIEIYNFAVCDVEGHIDFYHNNGKKKGSGSIHKPTDAIFKFEGMSFSEPTKIPCTTIYQICKNLEIEQIDVIHMDVQSAEYEALVGLQNIRPKLIFLETSAINFYEKAKITKDKLQEMRYVKINIEHITQGDELWIYKNK